MAIHHVTIYDKDFYSLKNRKTDHNLNCGAKEEDDYQWLIESSRDSRNRKGNTFCLKNVKLQQYLACDQHGKIYLYSSGCASDNQNLQWELQHAYWGSHYYLKNAATGHFLNCNTDESVCGRSNEMTKDSSNGPESDNYSQQWQFEIIKPENLIYHVLS